MKVHNSEYYPQLRSMEDDRYSREFRFDASSVPWHPLVLKLYRECFWATQPALNAAEVCKGEGNHFGFVSVETLPRALTCSCCGQRSLHSPPWKLQGRRGWL
jgi:hypothetical protein